MHEYHKETPRFSDLRRRMFHSAVSPPSEGRGGGYGDVLRDEVAFHGVWFGFG